MSKKKTLRKHEFSLSDIKPINIRDDKEITEFKVDSFFKDKKKVAEALLQCLIENDSQAFMEILDSYLRVNRSQTAIKANLSRSTISLALSKKGNPTIKTIAQIVHQAHRR